MSKIYLMKNSLKLSTQIGAAAMLAMTVQPTLAQEQGTDDFLGIENILISARKRQERLQDVPLAVTAIDQRQLSKAFAQTIADLERFVPNVELANNTFGGKQLNATIRGIGFADVEKSFEPAVGFSIDGVFLGTSGGASIDAFDIESVEVLRGPQGTLYGRNTIGGVINIRRTQPTEDIGLRARVRVANNGRREILAVGNTGRMGDVALKGYFFRTKSDTFSTNLVTGEKDPVQDNYAFGGALSYEPSNSFRALLQVDAFDDNSGQNPNYNLSLPGEALFCNLTLLPPGASFLTADSAGAGCIDQSLTIAEESDFEVHTQAVPVQSITDGYSLTSNIDWDIADGLTLTSVTGYRTSEETLTTDNFGSPTVTPLGSPVGVPIFYANRTVDQEQFSQELRLSGSLGDKLTYVGGLYYLNNEYSLVGGAGPLGTGFGTVFVFGNVATDFTAGQKTSAYAAFVDGSYKITDAFTVSAGMRYSVEKKSFDIDFIAGESAGQAASVSETFDAVTGRIILQYQIAEDIMAFGGWSRGFRSGGFNGRAASTALLGPYEPETVDNFEGGLRMEFFDRRLRFNPTVFYSKYHDKQEEVSRASAGGIPETIVQNAASATIWGVEIESLAQITPELSLRGTLGYLNAEYDEFLIPDLVDPTAPDIDVSDSRQLRRAPNWTLGIGAAYQRPVFKNVNFTATLDYSYIGDLAANLIRDTSGLDRDIIQSDGSLDFTVGFASNNESGPNWSITGYMVDALDGRNGRVGSSLDVGVFYFGVGTPTTRYGIELGVEF